MARRTSPIIALVFIVAITQQVMAQGFSRLEPDVAQNLFNVYASCLVYWKVISQCLPAGLKPADQAHLQQSFDRLQATGAEQIKWLGTKTRYSTAMQNRIIDQARSSVTSGSNCENGPALIQEFRDKCAALFTNIATAEKESTTATQPDPDEVAKSAADFIVSACQPPLDDISRVASYARMMHWKGLSSDEQNVAKPPSIQDFEGWRVDRDGDLYLVSVGHIRVKSSRGEYCQVAVPERSELIAPKIKEKLRTRLETVDKTTDEIKEIYELLDHPGVALAAMTISRPTDDRTFTVVSFLSVK